MQQQQETIHNGSTGYRRYSLVSTEYRYIPTLGSLERLINEGYLDKSESLPIYCNLLLDEGNPHLG